jgi:hypothetical protein
MKAEDAKKIISLAIDREVEAYAFYKSVADKVDDKALKSMFAELAGEEKKHREFLQAFLTRDVKTMKFDAKADYKVVDALKTPKLSTDLKPLEGLVIAIKKELEAMQMHTASGGEGHRDPVPVRTARQYGEDKQVAARGHLHEHGIRGSLVTAIHHTDAKAASALFYFSPCFRLFIAGSPGYYKNARATAD